jgi:hypothetical protein
MYYEAHPASNSPEDKRAAALAQKVLDAIPLEVQQRITRAAVREFVRTDSKQAAEMEAERLYREWLAASS